MECTFRKFRFPIECWQYKLIKRGWRSDPMTIGVIALMAMAGVGGAAAGGAFSGGKDSGGGGAPAPVATDTGAIKGVESVETQAANRRLARMSKYFTSPTGILDSTTGAQGVF